MRILLKESTTSSQCSDIFIACYSFCATLSTLANGIPIISTVHSNKMTTYILSRSSRVYIAVCEGKEKEQVMIIIIKQPNQNIFCEHQHQTKTNSFSRPHCAVDQTQNTNYISVPHHDIRMRILLKESTTSSLCSDIFIACYSFCATLSTLVNGIPIISTVHSNTLFKMTTYRLSRSARFYIAVCEENKNK